MAWILQLQSNSGQWSDHICYGGYADARHAQRYYWMKLGRSSKIVDTIGLEDPVYLDGPSARVDFQGRFRVEQVKRIRMSSGRRRWGWQNIWWQDGFEYTYISHAVKAYRTYCASRSCRCLDVDSGRVLLINLFPDDELLMLSDDGLEGLETNWRREGF